ncbi:MAG: hypothetical protein LBQ22_11105 [Bacteroidales bacterium]|jgi:hypothetical protein|nr:hypothetical protein [Bacteroidales bacterium]
MKNFKTILFILSISFFSLSAFSQEKNIQKIDEEKIKSEKVAFLTERVGLTVKEAQDFWPVFNEYEEKINKLFEEERVISNDLKLKILVLSEKELNEKTDRLVNIKLERANLEKEYHEKYKTVLPANKVALLYQANKEFRKHLMKKYNEKICFE